MTTTTATSSSSVATANNAASTTATTDDDDDDDDDSYYQESMAQSIVAYALNIGNDSFYDVKGYHSDDPFNWTAKVLREYLNECNALQYLQDFINDVIVPLEEDAYHLDLLEDIRTIFNPDYVISLCNQYPYVGNSKGGLKKEYGTAIILKMTDHLDFHKEELVSNYVKGKQKNIYAVMVEDRPSDFKDKGRRTLFDRGK